MRDSVIKHYTDNIWMLSYSGHGNNDGLHKLWTTSDIWSDTAYKFKSIPSISIQFACLTHTPSYDKSYGEYWLCKSPETGGVASFGATTITYTNNDRYYAKNIFKQLRNLDALPLGNVLCNGLVKYYKNSINRRRLQEVEKYVYFGDPTLNYSGQLYGKQNVRKENVMEKAESEISFSTYFEDGKVHVQTTATEYHLSVYSMRGVCLFSDRGSENCSFDISMLRSGVFVFVYSKGNEILFQEKVIIHH